MAKPKVVRIERLEKIFRNIESMKELMDPVKAEAVEIVLSKIRQELEGEPRIGNTRAKKKG